MLLIMPTLIRWLSGPQKKMPRQSVVYVIRVRHRLLCMLFKRGGNSSYFSWCEPVDQIARNDPHGLYLIFFLFSL